MRRLAVLTGVLLLLPLAQPSARQSKPFESPLAFASSDAQLVEAFSWAKRQATAYAFQGDPVGPWFEAALPGREAFCMRDVAHQAMGAHALGMQAHVRNMLRRFAGNVSAERDWCSLWEIDRHGRPAHADYRNDQDFWYNLPANFDVLDAAYRMFLWSGDPGVPPRPGLLELLRPHRHRLRAALVARRRRRHEAASPHEPRGRRPTPTPGSRTPAASRATTRTRTTSWPASTCSRRSTRGSRRTRESRRRGATSPRPARGCGRRRR